MKIICVYHSIDLDGWMSAAIVKDWFLRIYKPLGHEPIKNIDGEMDFNDPNPCLYFMGYNYGQSIPDLSGYDKVIMVDISFPKEEMLKLRSNLGKNFIWIDHHISAIKDCIPEEHKKPVFEGLQNVNYAACELVWYYFFNNIDISNNYSYIDKYIPCKEQCQGSTIYLPEIVRLLGMYDSFRHKGTDEKQKVLEFQYGARQCISNYEEAYDYLIRSKDDKLYESGQYFDNTLNQIYDKGKAIYQYLCIEAKQVYKNGFEIKLIEEITDHIGKNIVIRKFICINKERFNPINFGIDYHKDSYDGCASFYFDGQEFSFSIYNENGKVDCSEIAKQFGGGGHKGASGFRISPNTIINFLNKNKL